MSKSVKDKLINIPKTSGSQSDPNVATKLRQLSDLCHIVSAPMNNAHDLQTLNYARGLESIRDKLTDFLDNR